MAYDEPLSTAARRQIETLASGLSEHLGIGLTLVCDRLVGDTSFVKRFETGKSITLRKYDQFMAGASAIWPDDKAPWPEGIPRQPPHIEERDPRGKRAASRAA